METMLQLQKNEISSLKKQVGQITRDAEQMMTISENSMSELLEIAQQVVQDNEAFYQKLKRIERWMEQETLTPEFRNELLRMLEDDVAFKQKYEAELDQYHAELDERARKRALRDARTRGWEPEL